MFCVNGVPVCIVEHKNPKDGDAIERGIKQLRRYEIETPELIGAPQYDCRRGSRSVGRARSDSGKLADVPTRRPCATFLPGSFLLNYAKWLSESPWQRVRRSSGRLTGFIALSSPGSPSR
jgi:hypothetical protein